jgi:hypothetical protein
MSASDEFQQLALRFMVFRIGGTEKRYAVCLKRGAASMRCSLKPMKPETEGAWI